jgi:putative CocE/NonD family hydrolase
VDAGTAEAALARFSSAPDSPMEIWITANNHGHNIGADPFFPDRLAPTPSREAQCESVLDFAARVLRGETINRGINYYVMGAGEFRHTQVWPPNGVRESQFFLAPRNALTATLPRAGQIDYAVDFSAETGANTRWSTQIGAPPAYPDRRDADRKLVVFDSEPMSVDMELVGAPIVDLYLSTLSRDPAVFAYLEDVAPDGRVTYLTEGMLRAVSRAPADPNTLPYDQGEAPHSFARGDALPITPGEVMQLRFALFPTATRIQRGHRLRLAIAGADAAVFRRYSEGGEDVFTIRHGGATASSLTVEMRPWE